MLIVDMPDVTDPHLNLAVEEHLLRHVVRDKHILFFYVNEPSIIVGRNQNVFEETDLIESRRLNIPVIRRLSGGGTVFHDLGNLNYSFIAPGQELLNDFVSFTRPVISALEDFGLVAELRNRSSIFIKERKVSGNAQYATSGRLVSHGTLLFEADLEMLKRSVNAPESIIESRAIRSVHSPVINLRHLLDKSITLDEVKERLRSHFIGSANATVYRLSDEDWNNVRALAGSRYKSWSWNIGRSPAFSVTRRVNTIYGEMEVHISVEKGCVRQVSFGESVPGNHASATLTACLQDVRYEPGELAAVLQHCNLDETDLGITRSQLVDLFY